MDDPELWRWIWLVTAVVFVLGEMAFGGTFFLLPFGLGAAVAAGLAFSGVGIGVEWAAFLLVSAAAVAATRPLARRLDRDSPANGVGARRLLGQPAAVLEAIPAGVSECGLVRVGREEWRAESRDGVAVPAGATVKVVDVVGTRVVVWPVDSPADRSREPRT